MFGALLGADLTAKQGVIFGYLARLLIVVPGAKIESLIDFLEEPEEVRPYLAKLDDPLTRRFFERQFFNKSFDETRRLVVLARQPEYGNPAFEGVPGDCTGAAGFRRLAVPYRNQQIDLQKEIAAGIGVTLTEESHLVPEQSTSAIIVPHPEAKYFVV